MAIAFERLDAAREGDMADRAPYAFWRHWPVDDQVVDASADAHASFQRAHDFDLLKVTPSSDYMVQSWGAQTEYQGEYLGVREYLSRPVREPEDWRLIEPRRVDDFPTLKREVEVVRNLAKSELGVPIVATVFNPLSIVRYLCGPDLFQTHVRRYRTLVDEALKAITQTTVSFIQGVLDAGADGIYVSAFPASYSNFSEPEYRDLARSSDLEIFEAARPARYSIMHFHLPYPILGIAADYPVDFVSWEHSRGGPDLCEGREIAGRAIFGGLDQFGAIAYEDPEKLAMETRRALNETGGRGHVLGASCSVPMHTPQRNLRLVREVLDDLDGSSVT